jgi:competence protein ComFC
LTTTPSKRVLEDGLIVYSAYSYKDIKNLLHTKHTYLGAKIFAQLTKHALLPLVKTFTCRDVFALPIDDHTRSGYSHTAIIVHELREIIEPIYCSLRAKNSIRYSGKKLSIREKEKRDFTLTCKENLNVILVDDIVTSGATLKEANAICKMKNIHVAFATTLCDASL